MNDATNQSTTDGRQADRVEFTSNVTIRFAGEAIVGSGQNISDQGVFFLTDKSLPVTIEIDGREGTLVGELVRVENMGPEQVGIAVRFQQPPAQSES